MEMGGIDLVKEAIDSYLEGEDFHAEDYSDLKHVGLAYTDSIGKDGETHNMQWYADFEEKKIYLDIDGAVHGGMIGWTISYLDYGDMADAINNEGYEGWVALTDAYAEEHL